MLKRILSIAGKPGLYRLINQGKNMLIVESVSTGKRMPAYARDKVVSLGDISMYTNEGDVALSEVLESLKAKQESNPVDVKAMDDAAVRELFGEVLPDFDRDRVYTTDIRKLFGWYNQFLAAGITDFKEEDPEAGEAAEAAESESEAK